MDKVFICIPVLLGFVCDILQKNPVKVDKLWINIVLNSGQKTLSAESGEFYNRVLYDFCNVLSMISFVGNAIEKIF